MRAYENKLLLNIQTGFVSATRVNTVYVFLRGINSGMGFVFAWRYLQ